MEGPLNDVSQRAMEKAAGFMCVDTSGLVLSAAGVAKEETGPFVAAVGKLASKLEVSGEDATVIIGTRSGNQILIKTREDLVTALFKEAESAA